jgi:hypothetical protein
VHFGHIDFTSERVGLVHLNLFLCLQVVKKLFRYSKFLNNLISKNEL